MTGRSSKIIVAADGAWVHDRVRSALAARDHEVIELTRGEDVRDAVAAHAPDLVILDMQIGNMGGVAVAIDLHLEASADRLPDVPVLLLLDREHDRFLAKRGVGRRRAREACGSRNVAAHGGAAAAGTRTRVARRATRPDGPAGVTATLDRPAGCGAVW